MDLKVRFWHLAGAALLGAAALEIVMILADGVRESFTVQRIPAHLATIVVGTVIGWMYDLLRETNIAFTRTIIEFSSMHTSVESLTNRIRYQEEALAMLTHCPRHNEVLTNLIRTSMSENFRNIPYIGEADYLSFLGLAIRHSDGYLGVQRKPLRWFRDGNTASYLDGLRERPMSYKKRILIVDDNDVTNMVADLGNQETLDYYWKHTGSVETYWISIAGFKKNCPKIPVPDDFGLFDRQLLIAYDTDRQILIFDLLDENRSELRIFNVQDELSSRGVASFQSVPRTAVAANRPDA